MIPVARVPAPSPRARFDRVAVSCGACGAPFTLHYLATKREPPAPSTVPCLNDACGVPVSVLLPPGASALWAEEF